MLRSADLRYHGQSFELPVTGPARVPVGLPTWSGCADEFHAMHERAYGYAAQDDPVELVNVRLAAIGVTPKPRRAPLPEGGSSAAPAVKGRRDVWFAEAGGVRPTLVLDRGKLLRGNVIDGPAIIEEPDASTLVHPGWTATVDEHANLVLRPLD
jgi:N-methylhydantoinase A